MLDFIKLFLEALFGTKKEEVVVAEIKTYGLIKYDSKNAEAVKYAKKRLNAHGFGPLDESNPNFLGQMQLKVKAFQKSKGLSSDGEIGPKTWVELNKEPVKSETPAPPAKLPWMVAARKMIGKKETDPAFNKEMSKKWSLFGMNLGTISESWAAWCGLFVAVVLTSVGIKYQTDGALARNWGKYGTVIEYKVNGIPEGSVVWVNSSANCKSSSGNHVTFANGSCSVTDVTKAGATFAGIGGNQSNSVKVSIYKVANICGVRWPVGQTLPAKVTKSVNCTGTGSTNESTR